MAIRKLRYSKRKKAVVARQNTHSRNKQVYSVINGIKRELFQDYVAFLKTLDTKNSFKKIGSKIIPKSNQWNQIRRKRITASQTKRIYTWTKATPYIYKKITRYISSKSFTRGDAIEHLTIKMLKEHGFQIKYEGNIWMHRSYMWISCTTDAVIMKENKVIAAVEIKSFTSVLSFNKAFVESSGTYVLKKSSQEYYQMQMTAEILNVTHILFVFEYKNIIRTQVIERDLDFLYLIFPKLKEFYFRYLMPFNLYGICITETNKKKTRVDCLNDSVYNRLVKLLENNEELVTTDISESFMHCHFDDLPSSGKEEFFDLFTDKDILENMNTNQLNKAYIPEDTILAVINKEM